MCGIQLFFCILQRLDMQVNALANESIPIYCGVVSACTLVTFQSGSKSAGNGNRSFSCSFFSSCNEKPAAFVSNVSENNFEEKLKKQKHTTLMTYYLSSWENFDKCTIKATSIIMIETKARPSQNSHMYTTKARTFTHAPLIKGKMRVTFPRKRVRDMQKG